MGIDELEKFCAENGVSFTELQSWRDLSLSAMENSGDGNVMSVKQHEDEVAKLKAELARKEKALAEAAALLILQKNFGNFGTGKVAEPKKLEILAAMFAHSCLSNVSVAMPFIILVQAMAIPC